MTSRSTTLRPLTPSTSQRRVFWWLGGAGLVFRAILCLGAYDAELTGLARVAGLGVIVYLSLLLLMRRDCWRTVILLAGLEWWFLVRECILVFGYEVNFQLYFLLLTSLCLLFEVFSLKQRLILALLPLILFVVSAPVLSKVTPEVLLNASTILWLKTGNTVVFALGTIWIVIQFAVTANNERMRAKALAEARAELIATLSHELKTPLAAVLTTVQSTLKRSREADEYQLALQLCERNTHGMRTLIQRMLDLSYADSEAWHPQWEMLRGQEVLEACLARHAVVAEAAGVLLVVEAGEDLSFESDAGMLAIVLDNLVTNALEHSRQGGQVTLRARAPEVGFVEICVADQGQGIAPDDLPYIFDAFFRAERSRTRRKQNFGLGLAIAQRFATKLGIVITVDSVPGQGAEFRLKIPQKRRDEAGL